MNDNNDYENMSSLALWNEKDRLIKEIEAISLAISQKYFGIKIGEIFEFNKTKFIVERFDGVPVVAKIKNDGSKVKQTILCWGWKDWKHGHPNATPFERAPLKL